MRHQELLCQAQREAGGVANHDVYIIEGSPLDVNSMSQEMPLDSQPSGHKKGFANLSGKFCQSMFASVALIWSRENFGQKRIIERVTLTIRHSLAILLGAWLNGRRFLP